MGWTGVGCRVLWCWLGGLDGSCGLNGSCGSCGLGGYGGV